MSYLKCNGAISVDGLGNPQCSGTWESVPDTAIESIFQAMTIEQALEVSAAILVLWATAYGLRFLVNFLTTTNPGRFG